MTATLKALLTVFFLIVIGMVGANAYEFFNFGGLKGAVSSILLVGPGGGAFIAGMIILIVSIWRKK